MARALHFSPWIDPVDLVGRVLGPDRYGASYVVTFVEQVATGQAVDRGGKRHRTRAEVRVFTAADQDHLFTDAHGQPWVSAL
jgi:hypothetical protein